MTMLESWSKRSPHDCEAWSYMAWSSVRHSHSLRVCILFSVLDEDSNFAQAETKYECLDTVPHSPGRICLH